MEHLYLRVPFGFGINKTGAPKGLELSIIKPLFRRYSTCSSISFRSAGDTLVGAVWDTVWGPAIMPAFVCPVLVVLAAFWDI